MQDEDRVKRSGLLPEPLAGWRGIRCHPDAPAGGSGPGSSRSAMPTGMDVDVLRWEPHPHSPVGLLLAQAGPGSRLNAPRQIAWGALVSPQFKKRVIEISDEIGIDPDWLMAIMALETGRTFRADQRNTQNPKSGPVGLLQFTEDGASSLGTTKDALAAMNALQQLEYVQKWFAPYKGKKKADGRALLSSLEDVYAAVHYPAAVRKADEATLYEKGKLYGKKQRDLYKVNSGLDENHDGRVTRGEAAEAVRKLLEEGKDHAG